MAKEIGKVAISKIVYKVKGEIEDGEKGDVELLVILSLLVRVVSLERLTQNVNMVQLEFEGVVIL
jgi:hypothetical protein